MFQDKALAILKSGRNVFLTGPAGSGKTYILNAFIQYLHEHGVRVAVTASTGIAATHMKGTTIHSWSGIGIKDNLTHSDLRHMRSKSYLLKNIEKTHVLIIDEISMLHLKQLDLVNRVMKYMRNDPSPFGGMQVVFAGDFFQLPPVGSKNGEQNRDKFAFMSTAWLEAAPVVCYLSEQHRQSNNRLNQLLNELRQRDVSQDSWEMIQERMNLVPKDDLATRLYTHNADVDAINDEKLRELEGDEELFLATKKGNKKILESMVRSLIVPEQLRLKVGAKVMFVKNDHEKQVMNGMLGEVTAYDPEDGWPFVQLKDGRVIRAERTEWSVEDEKGKTLASFKQVPLRLAWAITVHKSQGMTLEAAQMDLTKTFERGQGYVALSRLMDEEGLFLEGINRMALEVDPLAAKADDRFQELSKEADRALDIEELELQFNAHLLKCEGQLEKLDPEVIKKGKSKLSTYEKTKALIEQGKSLEQIADIRELTQGTIIAHLTKLYDKAEPPEHLKPDEKKMKEIIKACEKIWRRGNKEDLHEDGEIRLNSIMKETNNKFDYAELKLARLYLNDELIFEKS